LRRTHKNAHFVILGESHGTHREYESRLWRQAHQLGLRIGEDVLVQSPGSRVAALAPALDVYWSTSVPRSEGVPTAVSEAMALEIPAVVTDAGGTREIVQHDVTGFVTAPFDYLALASYTRRILDDRSLAERLAREGRKTAVALCSIEATTEVHLKAFETALRYAGER
jgi:glycosyltransferase involved in cell wall biosynthesis